MLIIIKMDCMASLNSVGVDFGMPLLMGLMIVVNSSFHLMMSLLLQE